MTKKYFSLMMMTMLLAYFFVGCKDEGDDVDLVTPNGHTLSFKNDIQPIFSLNGCVGCHGGNGGMTLTSYNSLMTTGDHKPIVTAGNGEGSVIVKKLRGTAGFGSRMPQGGNALPDADIKKISDWIQQGALNN